MKSPRLFFFMAGVGITASVMFLTGADTGDKTAKPEASRYQIAAFSAASGTTIIRGWHGYYVLDTSTGKVIDSKVTQNKYLE